MAGATNVALVRVFDQEGTNIKMAEREFNNGKVLFQEVDLTPQQRHQEVR